MHIRRFDSITKLVLIAVLCVHWFNPLVWAMYILANRDIELSCDEAVVRLFGENTRAAYARTLISMEETRSGLTPLCNNFNKNAIEERITAIMKMKKTSMFSLVLAVALIVGVTTVFATSAFASSAKESEKQANILELAPSSNEQIIEKSIDVADSNNTAGMVQLVGDYAVDNQATISLDDLSREDATSILENAQPMKLTLISVSHDDERKFAPEEWAEILELIEQGEMYWED